VPGGGIQSLATQLRVFDDERPIPAALRQTLSDPTGSARRELAGYEYQPLEHLFVALIAHAYGHDEIAGVVC
jgi:hypothetical protein